MIFTLGNQHFETLDEIIKVAASFLQLFSLAVKILITPLTCHASLPLSLQAQPLKILSVLEWHNFQGRALFCTVNGEMT